MASLNPDAVPANLQRVLKKVNNYKRNVVKLLPDSSSSVSPNGQLRVKLPTNLVVNMSSIQMHGDLTIAAAAAQCPAPEQFISQVDFRAGGQSLMHINNYGDCFQTLANATMSNAHQATRHVMADGLGPHEEFESVAGDLTTARNTIETNAADEVGDFGAGAGVLIRRDVYDSLATGTYYPVTSSWLGLQDLGYLACDMLPQCELELTMAGNEILGSAAGAATWAYSNVYFTIETIQYPTYQNSLYAVVTPDPDNGYAGAEVYYPFKRYVNLMFGKDTSSSVDLKFSVASSSLSKIFFSCKNNAYATAAAKTDGNPPNYWIFTDTSNTQKIKELQCFIDERVYPNYRIENGGPAYAANYEGGSCLAHNLREAGVHNDNQFDCLIPSEQTFKRCKWFALWNFENLSGDDQMSGINTMGLSSGIRIHIDWTAAPATGGNYYAFLETDAVLAVGSGRQVRVEY